MHRYAAFAIGVLRAIFAVHRYTTHSALLSYTLVTQFPRRAGGSPRDVSAVVKILPLTLLL